MKRKFIIKLLIMTMFIVSLPAYADNVDSTNRVITELSLEKAIEEGVKNSSQLKISDLDIKVKSVELSEARFQEKKHKNSDFSFGTVEGFQLDANMLSKSAEFALEEEKMKKDYLIEDIKYNVTRAYYGVIQARDYLDITNRNLDNIQRNREILSKKLELGVVSKSDLLMADIALNESKLNKEKVNQDLERAGRALNIVLNYPLDTKIKLTSSFKENLFTTDLDLDIENAYIQRFDMIQLKNNHELVTLDFKTNSMVYPSNTFKYKYKESSVAKMENLLHDSKISIEFDISEKYDAIRTAERQIELSKSNVEKAKEGLRLRELSYDVGMGTILEVKESIVQLHNAELATSNAISAYNLAVLEYNKTVNLGTIR